MYLRRHTSNAAKPIRNATSSQMYVGMNSRRAMTSDTSMTPSVGFRRMFLCSGYMPTVGRAGVR